MAVNNEVAVGRLLVLANAGFDQWRVFQGGEAEGNVFANIPESLRVHHALAVRRIESRSARVVRGLESAPVAARDSVTKASAVIAPDGQMRVAEPVIPRRRTKEKNVLLGGLHKVTDGLWEQLPKPRPASKHITVGLNPGPIRQRETAQ